MSTTHQRILFMVSSLGGGGAERVATLLCNHWVSQGHEVVLMVTYSGRGSCVYRVDRRVVLRYLADETTATKSGPLGQLRRLLALRRAIVDLTPDRVISFLTNVNVAALLATSGTRIPLIVSERIFPPQMPVPIGLRIGRAILYPKATAVVMQTTDGLDWLKTASPRSRGVTIPNPVQIPLPLGSPVLNPSEFIEADTLLLLAVGRLSEQKRFDLLIETFHRLHTEHPQWALAIVGDGPQRGMLVDRIASLGLQGKVLLPGRAGNVGHWYQRAAAFAMTSSFEGFPNALLEALAHGLPAVSFDIKTGPRDLIRPGVNGWLVDPIQGADGLESALREMLSGECRPGTAATSMLRSRFALDAIAQQWLDIPV